MEPKRIVKRAELLDRISVNPDIMVGKPCVRGTRIPVYLVLKLLGNGAPMVEVLEEYPSLTSDDVLACLTYAGAILEPIRLANPTVDFELTRELDPWA